MAEPLDSAALDALLSQARGASAFAHSPYSGARVGAAVVDAGGRVFTGCNVENASYGLTQCAERAALCAAVAAGARPGEIPHLVIYASGFVELAPCGACRQVMAELMGADGQVHACDEGGRLRSWSVGELLPEPFLLDR